MHSPLPLEAVSLESDLARDAGPRLAKKLLGDRLPNLRALSVDGDDDKRPSCDDTTDTMEDRKDCMRGRRLVLCADPWEEEDD